LRLVLARDLRAVSILLWCILFFNQLSLHLISSWIPLFAAQGGASAQQGALALGLFTISGVIAAPILMKMVDVRGPQLIIIMPIGATVAVASFALIPPNEMVFFFLCALAAGLFQIGGNIGFQSLTGQYYTTSIRGSAIGWAFAIGNIGSVVGPAAGGLLLGADVPLNVIFILSASPLILVAICVALLTRTRQSRSLTRLREG
jgi:AAHS family 4-hydroxybenzoate transporter-like MFS transporter